MANNLDFGDLLKFYDDNRGQFSKREIIQRLISDNKYDFSWEQANELPLSDIGIRTIPKSVIQFLMLYLKDKSVSSLLSPASGIGVLPTALVREGIIKEAISIDINPDYIEFSKRISQGLNIDWKLGNPLEILPTLDDRFDLVLTELPYGWKSSFYSLSEDPSGKKYRDSERNIVVLESLSKLNETGQGIFILPNNFVWEQESRIIEKLYDLGFFIYMIIDIPRNTIHSNISISQSIFFISREKYDKAFVYFLDPDKTAGELVDSINKFKRGEKVNQGYQIEVKNYRSWEVLSLNNEIDEETRQSGTSSVFLGEIATSIKRSEQKQKFGGFQEQANALYLPKIGNSPVVTKLDDLLMKPQNYYQIILDEKKAFSEYVAGYFNSPLGIKVRKLLESGNVIPQIPTSSLSVAKVLLPPIAIQIQIVNLQNRIQNFKLNLDLQEKIIWAEPKKVQLIERQLRVYNPQAADLFKSWVDSLPFPLASILWRYNSNSEIRNKVEHLLHFFEAFAQFNTTFLLSAFYANEKYFKTNKTKWIDPDNDFYKSKRASFGNWVTIGERVARFTREQLSNKENRTVILDLFHTENLDFINLVSNKDLYQVFRNVNPFRNDWTGHGGISSENEYKRRLTLLEGELTSIRELVKDTFTDFVLVVPESMIFSKGIYLNKVRSIMGSNSLFPELDLETNIPLDVNDLYFIDKSRRDPLKLIHFIRMDSSPETEKNACYFYNRFELKGIRFVSYHFETKPEENFEDPGLVEFFNRLAS